MARVNHNPDRLAEITEHLQLRFKERHGITLNRTKRLILRKQIDNRVASRMYTFPNGRILYKCYLFNHEKQYNVDYHIIYCPKMKRILTVLPEKGSDEYEDFIRKNGLDRGQVENRELTAKERTLLSVNKYIHNKKQLEEQERLEERRRRIAYWEGFREYQRLQKKVLDFEYNF